MDWDAYFYDIANAVSARSPDPDTKHGCVIVDKERRVVSTGYNGPIKEFPNERVEYTRPQKYLWMIHAEDNAVTFARKDLSDTTAYITGHPCCNCFRRLVQAGVKRVVYGTRMSKCLDPDELRVCDTISKELGIELVNFIED
tara:strand:- start:5 stop:430 length:426 start_codon:yes stop_codon:yes gene_type:complete